MTQAFTQERFNKMCVITNGGNADGFSNSCMWISIRDYLHLRPNNRMPHITVAQLRQEGGLTDPYFNDKQFYYNDEETLTSEILQSREFVQQAALKRVLERYGLFVMLYNIIHGKSSYITLPLGNNNRRNERVNIVSFGGHYELIVSINDFVYVNSDEAKKRCRLYEDKFYDEKTKTYQKKEDIKLQEITSTLKKPLPSTEQELIEIINKLHQQILINNTSIEQLNNLKKITKISDEMDFVLQLSELTNTNEQLIRQYTQAQDTLVKLQKDKQEKKETKLELLTQQFDPRQQQIILEQIQREKLVKEKDDKIKKLLAEITILEANIAKKEAIISVREGELAKLSSNSVKRGGDFKKLKL